MRALLRCDASANIGSGHVMRCLSFAETLNWAGWSCTFATHQETLDVVPALHSSGNGVFLLEQGSPENVAADLVVVDHYGIDAVGERRLGRRAKVVVFDDLADRAHDCDVLVDPTPGRSASDYRGHVPAKCRLLLGPQYAILSSAWVARRAAILARLSDIIPATRVLVSMGGTDPGNATERVINGLVESGLDAQVDVVIGPGAPHAESIRRALGPNMTLHVSPTDFIDLCERAQLVIGAPGTSSFERALLGKPSILIPVADNQRFIAETFAQGQLADVVSPDLLEDTAALGSRIRRLADDAVRRSGMSRRAAALTDGRGRQRLLVTIAGEVVLRTGQKVRLRFAEPEDELWLLDLQRQEATRRYANNPAIPSAQGHAQWFGNVLTDMKRILCIVELDGEAVGMVRLDRTKEQTVSFEISIAISTVFHGKGIGSAALALAREIAPGADLIATVKAENHASVALFSAAGYRPEGSNRYRRQRA